MSLLRLTCLGRKTNVKLLGFMDDYCLGNIKVCSKYSVFANYPVYVVPNNKLNKLNKKIKNSKIQETLYKEIVQQKIVYEESCDNFPQYLKEYFNDSILDYEDTIKSQLKDSLSKTDIKIVRKGRSKTWVYLT